ncbi:hypothetical protein A9Q91_03875 [Candidatus Gracilibacteria bacterium 28_42_T64]|nr:hypothetical protein A9Q91_03875 [Candidatus Gracilibacteria bacterium 28_42_T64]
MKLFKSKLANRLAIAKTIGFVFGLLGFFLMPVVFNETDLMLRFAFLAWYTTFGVIIGLFGIMKKHPVINMPTPFWFRGIFMGAWLNFVLALFMYDRLVLLIQGTTWEGMSPFWIILEGLVIGLIIDYFATKFGGEGKELLK